MNAPIIRPPVNISPEKEHEASTEQGEALASFDDFLERRNLVTSSNDFLLGPEVAQALARFVDHWGTSYPQRPTYLTDPHISIADLKAKWLDYEERRRRSQVPAGLGERVENGIAKNRAWGIFLDLAYRFLRQQREAGSSEANP